MKMSDNKSNSLYLDLLKESEKFCAENRLTTHSDLICVPDNDDEEENNCAHFALGDDLDFRIAMLPMIKAPYFEKIVINEDTEEAEYYAFCYCDYEDAVSPVYVSKVHVKPRENFAEQTVKFISIDNFNKFFENASLEKIKNFKCFRQSVPAFLDLLRQSEKYCERNNLTTHKDLRDIIAKRIETENFSYEDRKQAIAVMRNAAFCEKRYEEEFKDVQYYTFAFDEDSRTPVLAMSLCEQADDLRIDYYDIPTFSELLSNTSFEQVKHFKCFRDVK